MGVLGGTSAFLLSLLSSSLWLAVCADGGYEEGGFSLFVPATGVWDDYSASGDNVSFGKYGSLCVCVYV